MAQTMEDELDFLLSQLDDKALCKALEPNFDLSTYPTDSASSEPHTLEPRNQPLPPSNPRFGFVTDEDLDKIKRKAVPKNTEKNTSWAVNIWKQWSSHRCEVCSSYSEWPTHLMIAEPTALNYWLSKFVLETRKANGQHYPPDTLYGICTGLLRFIRETRPEINIFKDPTFTGFQRTLDGEMKRLRSLGLGVKKRQAEPITVSEEGLLWEKGFLGDSNPQSLLDTMLFLCGIHFALRSGEEHRSLQLSQFELVNPKDGPSYILYTENCSKNNQGGLLHRKVKPKCVTCYVNDSNPQRCLVNLFKIYMSHRPAHCSNFYLTPLRKVKGDLWYSKVPVGHNTLSRTIQRLCTQAGIPGFKTNHSLRVTSATRLFQSGIDEQLIMARTGHRSIDGVRSYKRISDAQKKSVSDVLNNINSGTDKNESDCDLTLACPQKKCKHDIVPDNTITQPLESSSTANTCIALTNNLKSASSVPSFTFTGCSSVTINYNIC